MIAECTATMIIISRDCPAAWIDFGACGTQSSPGYGENSIPESLDRDPVLRQPRFAPWLS